MKLSMGRWHERIPRDLKGNLLWRQRMLKEAKSSRTYQKALIAACQQDVIFYINSFVYQYNPSKQGIAAAAPFITYPFQDDAILARPETHKHLRPYDRGILWCYENDKTMACEKSRWQGASWLFLLIQNWLCGFHDYVQTLNISRNSDAVDDGSRNSLFWKLRYVQAHQPPWLMGEIESSKLYFHFARTRSEITGEASTARAGAGGRASIIFVDEYPMIEKAQEVRETTALTANCRFFNGTHLGVGTPFQKMCDPRESPEIVRMQMHWTAHPEQSRGMYEYNPAQPNKPILHDHMYEYPEQFQFLLDGTPTGGPRPGVRSPWYDAKCAELGDSRATAMNLDISPEGAARQFFDGLKVRQIIRESARPPVWRGEIITDKRGKFSGLTEERDGRLKLWVQPKGDNTLPGSKYFVGIDVSGGTGATNSCIAGIDGERSMKVLEYSNSRISEMELALVGKAICEMLADEAGQGALLAWDASGQQGTRFEQAILELGYPNIYYNDDDKVRTSALIRKARRPGWFGYPAQKYSMLVDMRQALYERKYTDRSEECLLELLMFEYDSGTGRVVHGKETRTNDPSGAGQNHSDMAIATGICWMMAKDMAEGGRRSSTKNIGPQPGSLEWLLALQSGARKRLEEYV